MTSDQDKAPDMSRGRHSIACYKGNHDDCGRYVPNVGCHCVCHEKAEDNATQGWEGIECVICGHGYDDHLEPNADTPYCQVCDEDPDNPTQRNFAAHYMGWPTEFVMAALQRPGREAELLDLLKDARDDWAFAIAGDDPIYATSSNRRDAQSWLTRYEAFISKELKSPPNREATLVEALAMAAGYLDRIALHESDEQAEALAKECWALISTIGLKEPPSSEWRIKVVSYTGTDDATPYKVTLLSPDGRLLDFISTPRLIEGV